MGRRSRLSRARRTLAASGVVAAVALAAAVLALGTASAQSLESYPTVTGGEWVRGPNLKDRRGRFQPRQEHAAAVLNGFVYLIGGFVPLRPAPQPTEDEPEPFPFAGTGEVLVYTPRGRLAEPLLTGRRLAQTEGNWTTLPRASSFPQAHMHHIVAVTHQGKIWTFGGHAGGFAPTRHVFVFTPSGPDTPVGTWSRVSLADGGPCGQGEACLRLPRARAAGAAVSVGSRIYLMGGVEPYRRSPDPVNRSIRTTSSVVYLDTASFPLRWRAAPPLRQRREHFNAVVAGGRIWAFHGRNEVSTHMRGVESLAPGDTKWRREQDAPVGTSANILGAVGDCVYSFGGEFIASNVTGTLIASQVFHLPTRSWRRLESRVASNAAGATSKHGTFGVVYAEDGVTKIMAPGGAATAWFDPMSKVHIFIPPASCA